MLAALLVVLARGCSRDIHFASLQDATIAADGRKLRCPPTPDWATLPDERKTRNVCGSIYPKGRAFESVCWPSGVTIPHLNRIAFAQLWTATSASCPVDFQNGGQQLVTGKH